MTTRGDAMRRMAVGMLLLLGASLLAIQWAANRASAATASTPVAPAKLVWGVYAHIRPTELYKKMAPIQAHLQESLETSGVSAEVVLKIFPTYAAAIDALAGGEVDFARFGPVSYVLAKGQNPAIQLLAMESNAGKKRFNGVISVPRDSPIQSIEDLQGKRIAFGNRRSTTGRYLAQAALVRAGIRAEDLDNYAYLDRHDKVAFAVAAGNYDAGATNENTFHKYAAQKGLRKLVEFPCVTKPWVARAGLEPKTFAAMQHALLELRDPLILKLVKRSGFLPAEDSDYDLIRNGMALSGEFDPRRLNFGVYASVKPSEVYNIVQPIVDLLEKRLAAEGDLYRIGIKVYRTYREAIDSLVRGDIDLGRLGPASYLLAKDRDPDIRAVVSEAANGKSVPGLFVVAAGSDLVSVSQLKGKTFAFGNRYSTAGRYVAQAELLKAGVKGSDLKGYQYLGRHDRVAYAVAAGNYDAGVLRKPVFDKHGRSKELKVIGRFEVPHKVWVARQGIDDELFASLRHELMEMAGADVFSGTGMTGFAPFDDAAYESVRMGIEVAAGFEARE